MLVAALSTAHKLGLGISGLLFILFALITSMVIPRRDPDFPGRHKSVYILVCFLFFVGMLTAVLVFGKESGPPEKHKAAAPVIVAS